MKRGQKKSRTRREATAYCPAFERLDEALEQNAPQDNAHKIRLLRLAMFADVDKLQASDTVKIPD